LLRASFSHVSGKPFLAQERNRTRTLRRRSISRRFDYQTFRLVDRALVPICLFRRALPAAGPQQAPEQEGRMVIGVLDLDPPALLSYELFER
jgi:hypothetical protein